MIRAIKIPTLILFLLIAFGCEEADFRGASRGASRGVDTNTGNFEKEQPHLTESFPVNETAGKVDIIFFFDQSNSMDQFINEVSQRLGAFIQNFMQNNSKFDYRLLVVAKTFNMPVQNDKVGITNIKIGNHGAIPTAKQLFTGQASSGNIKLRKNSTKEIVVVTNDRANVNADQFAQWARDNRREVGKIHVNGFVGFKATGFLGRLGPCYVDHAGADYRAMGNHPDLGGLVQDICSPNWDSLMNKLGEKITANTTSVFSLSKKPKNTDSLKINIGDKLLSSAEYEYDEKDNSVEILIPLSKSDTVQISYDAP